MQRKQFTFYRSFWENIQHLPTNKEKLQAFELLCEYGLNETEPDLDTVKPGAAMVFRVAYHVLHLAHKRADQAKQYHEQKMDLYDRLVHSSEQDKE